MQTATIKGVYEEGHIILKEEAPVNTRTEVVVTFLIDEKETPKVKRKGKAGGLKGLVDIPDDFNDMVDYW